MAIGQKTSERVKERKGGQNRFNRTEGRVKQTEVSRCNDVPISIWLVKSMGAGERAHDIRR